MTIPDRQTLTASANELTTSDHLWRRLHDHLEADLAAMMREDKSKPKKQPAPPSPWNDTAAHLIGDIAAGARRHETALTLLLFNRARYRGGDDNNTLAAILALPDLITTATERHPADPSVKDLADQAWQHQRPAIAAADLTLWPLRCRALLDELRTSEEPWTAAPGGLECPYCRRRLHLAPGWEHAISSARVVCRACPARVDPDERPRPDRDWPASAWIGALNEPDVA